MVNNKYMVTVYDPTRASNHCIHLDTYNDYSKAMSNPMLQTGFTWLSKEQWCTINWVP